MDPEILKPSQTEGELSLVHKFGFWSALATIILGTVYSLVILGALLTGNLKFPPSQFLQDFGGVNSLLVCPSITLMMVALHTVTSPRKKVLSLAALGMTLLFALSVSINRFSQLGAVRQAQAAGGLEGISWFLSYGDRSIMLGLEMMGWGWFLGMALLLAAPLFDGSPRKQWLRWLCVVYGVLGLISAIGYLVNSPISAVGFVDWGLILYIICILLMLEFKTK